MEYKSLHEGDKDNFNEWSFLGFSPTGAQIYDTTVDLDDKIISMYGDYILWIKPIPGKLFFAAAINFEGDQIRVIRNIEILPTDQERNFNEYCGTILLNRPCSALVIFMIDNGNIIRYKCITDARMYLHNRDILTHYVFDVCVHERGIEIYKLGQGTLSECERLMGYINRDPDAQDADIMIAENVDNLAFQIVGRYMTVTNSLRLMRQITYILEEVNLDNRLFTSPCSVGSIYISADRTRYTFEDLTFISNAFPELLYP